MLHSKGYVVAKGALVSRCANKDIHSTGYLMVRTKALTTKYRSKCSQHQANPLILGSWEENVSFSHELTDQLLPSFKVE